MTDYKQMILNQRRFFAKGTTKNLEFRMEQLQKLQRWINEHDDEILNVLKQDLNKAPVEGYATEVGIVKEELRYAIKHLRSWGKVKRVHTPITQFPSRSFIYPEPYGTVLIMSPWNYPFQLTVAPLIAALCAGNCAVLKPSAYSVATSALMHRMVDELFDPAYVAVVEGGRAENEGLLNERFDYIFFTGGVEVGKLVMEKAAKYVTPVSLELGGKSPCIVDETANINMAAKRIVWGKFLNAGQTCVAPDYVLVHRSVKDKLIRQMMKQVTKMYGKEPCRNPDYPKIINERHLTRLKGLLDEGKIATGGTVNDLTRQMAPTILDGVTWGDNVMSEEIFGPILPVLVYDSMVEVVQDINARPKPLALYLFTKSASNEAYVMKHISYGGGCINDTICHLATSEMPFGGVGTSGMGSYHGKAGFDTFTHYKSMMKKSTKVDLPFRYPPYKNQLDLLKKIQ
ncbi:aldehyde dehydrogenase [Hespellia stercorisuis]|uniref:Aldehyde dehydrogenase n=1 Tax=Hespellia stercorisuis DSM 15480 TaxID=1121950 RepID=A0A1M6R3E1_9FIRM|nr:aldehyde dehydrogenase [Hespellia stercorisuis]SHK26974.1 aldehyde dehydrogenase (NAD+) [Hespellia stercorisuis DSM 15480]